MCWDVREVIDPVKMMLSQKVLIWMAKQKAPNARRVIVEQ